MRQDIINIVNLISEDYSNKCREAGSFNLSFDLMHCYSLILEYCKDTKSMPSKNAYKQVNGLLYINDSPIDRVALRYNRPRYEVLNNTGIDYESLILARQDKEVV